MTHSTFKGKITVRHAAQGFSVRFDPGTETDAHDLGHALAAIMTTYNDQARKDRCPRDLLDSMHEDVMSGIRCGLAHNPEPLKSH